MQEVVVVGAGLQWVEVVNLRGPESQMMVVEADCHFCLLPPHGSGPQSEKVEIIIQ